MSVTIDASSPAVVTGNSVNAITTVSFNPPANSLILAMNVWATSGTSATSVAMTNNGAALDTAWSQVTVQDQFIGTNDGHASIYWGRITSGRTGMTITATPTAGKPFDNYGLLKVYIITGFNTSNPLGTNGRGESDSNAITPTVYTSTATNSRGFGCGSDATANGVAPTSSDTSGGTVAIASGIDGIALSKAAVTAVSGTGVTLNFDATGAGAENWNWVAVEVRGDDEGGGGGRTVLNTRAFPLGMAIGMNWRSAGECS